MKIATGVTGKHSFDVLQNIATIGVVLSSAADARTYDKLLPLMKSTILTFEIVSTTNGSNRVLFRDIDLYTLARLTNVGSTLISQTSTGKVYFNIPVCLEGALVFDKSTFLRVTTSSEVQIDLYGIGSLTYGAEPIRIVKNTIRANEDAKLVLTGSSVIGYIENSARAMKFHSAVGSTFELKENEHQFVVNALDDFFFASSLDGQARIVDKDFITLPTTLAHKVEIEQAETESIYYLFYENYAVAEDVKCNC